MSRRVQVELHAQARDLAGSDRADVEVATDATCADLKDALAASHPRLAELLRTSVLATEREYLAETAPLAGEERFHLIPPVSGG